MTALVITIICLGLAYGGIRVIRNSFESSARPTYFLISLLGVIALGLIVIAFFYSARKRLMQERIGGTMMGWLKSHIYIGAFSVAAALAHTLLLPWTGGLTSGKIALGLLVLLIASGAVWRAVYLIVPPRVPSDVGNLSIRDTHERVSLTHIELEKLRVGKSEGLQRIVDDILEGRATAAALAGIRDQIPPDEIEPWTRAQELASRLEIEAGREKRQRRLSRTLQVWRAAHLPLAALLLVAIAVHLWGVFNVGRLFAGEAERNFASADDCASCHQDIVEEWKLSAHRNAQTSTITQAQTLLALQVNPEFETDCVNCHAPIATKFNDKTTFPVLDDRGINPDTATSEGITCVVCHAMEEHPEELAGFEDDLPIESRGNLSFGTMYGPPLSGGDPIPTSAHDIATGFMSDPVSSSGMCGTCHNVAADVDGGGLAPAGSNSPPNDSDDDGVLDENEFDVDNDLVLQSTFNEWEDFLFERGGVGPSCVDCHMPPTTSAVARGTPLLAAPERDRREHTFVGVDYELDTDYYEQPGMPEEALAKVLAHREQLLQQAVDLRVDIPPAKGRTLTATVRIKNRTGHNFPTGFAFARQFWLEVSAQTSSGDDVCLLDLGRIQSTCGSGQISSPSEDLKTCDDQPVAADESEVRLIEAVPASEECDPWLVNFQKILTDGDADDDGVFEEVAYQTKDGGVVKDRLRTVGDPLSDNDPQPLAAIPHGESARFAYRFDVSKVGDESISVKVVLRHRHLPPYFVRELEPFLPRQLTADDLLDNMTVVDLDSNKPLAGDLTSPSADDLLSRRGNQDRFVAAVTATSQAASRWLIVPLLFPVAAVPLARRRRRRS
ncbi:MAG: cytochrome c family protein [Actinomycetota bacterium]|nr:cytochrome c family protein [Actinomycetota bacterium]